MPVRTPSAVVLVLCLGSGLAEDRAAPMVLPIAPAAADSGAPLPSIPIAPAFPSRLGAPPWDPSLAPSLLGYPVLDSLRSGPKEFVFKEYWAEAEKEHGLDQLRARLGMLNADSRTPSALMPGTGGAGLNQLALGILQYRAWQAHDDRADWERRFHLRLSGVIDLAQRLEDNHAAAPGLSLIVAKLDFMGKRVKGRLPDRPERRRFTEDLKAWAVNPVFDSTGLGPALMEVCRLYEEYQP